MLRDESDAEDATQDTLVRAVLRVHQYRGEASISTWLCHIAETVCLNRLKKNKRRGIPESLDRLGESSMSSTDQVQMVPSERAVYLAHLLARIQFAAREHDPRWDDLDYLIFETYFHPDAPTWTQLGCILGLSPDTAKYRYYHHILPVIRSVGEE